MKLSGHILTAGPKGKLLPIITIPSQIKSCPGFNSGESKG
jgi:hypothetical protein